MIHRENDGPPTSPTVDAPSWLQPGAPQIEEHPAATVATAVERSAPHDAGGPASATDSLASPISSGSSSAPLRRIAQFVLLERIGAGGMGEVFAAFDEQLERKVAIKLVATRHGDDHSQQRLLREAQSLAQLSHPNVITVYEVDTLPDGGLFIAMELVKGQTLRAWQKAQGQTWRAQKSRASMSLRSRAWQKAQGRTWQEIVATYAAAGRGLAAAHDRGIVHRDFKPDNVLVGNDGRVRVADFGLAFAAKDAMSPAPRDAADAPGAGEPRDAPAGAMTADGRFAGTPGYMAPEQLAGGAVDARADQFSFCVALHEALHGERPGADPPRRQGSRHGEPDPSYPRWLGELLRRGLARDPAERFATMHALLAELTRSRERTRRWLLAGGLTGALAIAGVTSAALIGSSNPPPCPLATDELAGVWDAATRQRGEAAVLGTTAAFAASVWASTAAALDRYAGRWLGAHQAACEATNVRHIQSADLLDRRMECLASRRRSLAAVAEVLQHKPDQAVTHAGELLGSLGDIELCADTGVLLALPGPGWARTAPANADARARAAAVRQQLASASALLATGDVASANPVVAEAEQLARDLDDDAVHAEVLYLQGRVKLGRGDVAASITSFDRAVELAVAGHHDELPADVWLTLAVSAGNWEQRPAEIERWLGQSEAWIQRLGHSGDSRRVEVEHARGKLQSAAGDPRQAVITLSHALDTAERLWGKSDPRLIPLLRDRAAAEARLRQAKPAVADAERALALGIAAWGPSYPEIARTRRALGLIYIEQLGEVERGEHELGLALELYRAQLGADSIDVANCEQALSQAGQYRGDYAAALAHAERAEQIFAARLGPEHPRHGEALMGLGVLRFMRRDFAGSLAAYEAAYPILRAALGVDHTTIGIVLSNTGETLLALGRAEPARADFARALDILQHRLGPDHADLALPLKGLGLAYLSAGRPHDARAPLERALALRTQSAAANDPQEVAEIRWGIARALRALGREPARARELALAAQAGYRSLGSESVERVREIERWLANAVTPAPRNAP